VVDVTAAPKPIYRKDYGSDRAYEGVGFDPRNGALVVYNRDGITELDISHDGESRRKTSESTSFDPSGNDDAPPLYFSADGKRLVTTDAEGVRIWDTSGKTWHVTGRIPGSPPPAKGVAVVGDVLAAADGPTIVLWDIHIPADPKRIATLGGHTGDVRSLVFTADGSRLFSGSKDESVRSWDVTAYPVIRGAIRTVVCQRVQRGLTRAEWKQYVSGVAYQDTCA
jgi:WD40 repeat protein